MFDFEEIFTNISVHMYSCTYNEYNLRLQLYTSVNTHVSRPTRKREPSCVQL
jgi:hypothetical protein